jgi:glycosyltransferase involved in cell wall biosynthesis
VRRRVLLYSDTVGLGGAEEVLFRLAVNAPDAGYAAEVLLPEVEAIDPLVARLEAAGIPVIRRRIERQRPWAERLAASLTVVRDRRPDVLHVHRPSLGSSVPGLVAAALARVPRVVVRECLPDPLNGWFPQTEPPRRGIARLRPGPMIWRVRRRLTRRLPIVAASAIIVPSAAARMLLLTDYFYPARRTFVVPNGIDAEEFQAGARARTATQVALGLPASTPVVITSARLVREKGIETLLRAFARVTVSPPPILLVAGDGPVRPALEVLARELSVGSRVRFLGWRSDIAALLGVADVFVLPTMADAFPNAILEAMAAGRPVVASRIECLQEVVVDGQTGLLVPPADAEALAEALSSVLRNPERGREMGLAGMRRAQEAFPRTAMLSKTYALWRGQQPA